MKTRVHWSCVMQHRTGITIPDTFETDASELAPIFHVLPVPEKERTISGLSKSITRQILFLYEVWQEDR